MEFILVSTTRLSVEVVQQGIGRWLLGEDARAIRSAGYGMIRAKQQLQAIEKYICYASSILVWQSSKSTSRSPGDPNLKKWINDGQLYAFCLEDQIAMYAIQGLYEPDLYYMKSAIGDLTIKRATEMIETHIKKMPLSVQILGEVLEASHFVPYSHHVSADEETRDRMSGKIGEIKVFLESEDKVFFVLGGWGSGKSALMDIVCADGDVMDRFRLRSRVDVSETTGLADLLKQVLEGSTVDTGKVEEFQIMETIHAKFDQNREYLIVLDNVQSTHVLQSLMCVLKDFTGKIICLTSSEDMAHGDQLYVRIEGLGENDDGRNLLKRAAFPNYKNLSSASDDGFEDALKSKESGLLPWQLRTAQELLSEILTRCGGDPQKIWTMGTLFRTYPVDKWSEIMRNELIDTLVHGDVTNHHPLLNKLEDARSPGDIRLCFFYCLAFPQSSEIPENAGIPKKKLVRLWMAEGFLQDSPHQSQGQQGEDLLDELINRRELVQVKTEGIDDTVLRCSVDAKVRSLASGLLKHQKFCRILPEDATTLTSGGTPAPPSVKGRLPWQKIKLSARYRMLAVHGDGGVKEAAALLRKDIRLRSMLYFETTRTTERQKLQLSFEGRYRLLRTLELEGAHLDSLPHGIRSLVCLRYLGLRGTQLEHLPTASLEKLKHLMCLDIRGTKISKLEDVSVFTEMRYLLLEKSCRDKSVIISQGLRFLIHLETLSGASVSSEDFYQQLSCLMFLRKLSIKKVRRASSERICQAIGMMKFLRSLTIATYDGEEFDVKCLKIGRNLQKLKLGGDMGPLCNVRLSMMQSITHLYLWDSDLKDDPLRRLQDLRHLLLLSLHNAYTGGELSCGNGYLKLKKLSIIKMENLKECTFGSGALNNLKELVFSECGSLKSPPAGLATLKNLKKVYLYQMHPTFRGEVGRYVDPEKVEEANMPFHRSMPVRDAAEGSQATAVETVASPAADTVGSLITDEPIPAADTAEGSSQTATC